jgi:RimJ/RimL family protein N-acetyltransferase
MSGDRAGYLGGPYSQSDAWDWFTNDTVTWQFNTFGTLAIETDGQLAGFVGLIHPPSFPEPECGWGLYDGFTGRGIATEAARVMLDYTFATTDLTTIVSYVDRNNIASQQVAKRLGGVLDTDAETPFGADDHVYRHYPLGVAA